MNLKFIFSSFHIKKNLLKIFYIFRLYNFFYFILFIFINIAVIFFILICFELSIYLINKDEKYISKESYINNENIMKEHLLIANKNIYGFNDINHKIDKEKDTFRIIVLGDSYIFGDGIKTEDVWSRQLESELQKDAYNIEIFHWGKCGWSTKDQFDFLFNNFQNQINIYNADLIIIAFVINDPDLTHSIYNNINIANTLRIGILNDLMPNVMYRINMLFEGLLHYFPIIKKGHYTTTDLIYDNNNLKKYEKLLLNLKNFIKEKNTDLIFVLTMHPFKENIIYSEKIETLLNSLNIKCFNITPQIVNLFMGQKTIEFISSPVNYHPARNLNKAYANLVKNKLIDNNYLNRYK